MVFVILLFCRGSACSLAYVHIAYRVRAEPWHRRREGIDEFRSSIYIYIIYIYVIYIYIYNPCGSLQWVVIGSYVNEDLADRPEGLGRLVLGQEEFPAGDELVGLDGL